MNKESGILRLCSGEVRSHGQLKAIAKPLVRHSGDSGLSRGLQNLDSGQARMTVLKWVLKTIIHNSLFIIHLRKGFTLIELIIVFSIIAFLSTIGIASYRTYSQSQTLQASVQDLVTTIQLAKSRANSQVKPLICVGQLDGYAVDISTLNNTYTLNAVCSGNSFPLQTTTLPNNLTFAEATNTTGVFFMVITGAVSGSGTIGITGYDRTKCISVDSVGLITQLSSC